MSKVNEDIEAEGDRNFVTAIARGFDVLRCFRLDETTLTNQEIASRTKLPKPTVSRLTYTLCKLGYLVQSDATGAYRLGAGVLALGFSALAGMEIGTLAKQEMRKLCSGPNPYVTAALAERHRLQVIYMAVRRSNQAVSLTMNVGARLPLFHSAIGRAVLIGMSEDEREAMLQLAIEEHPEKEALVRQSLQEAQEDYARYGFTTSFGKWRKEVNGIAVPIEALDGDRIYGLNVGGPSFLVSPKELIAEYGSRLRESADMIGRRGTGAI
ncbi:IclR family transcriptional regulator [Paracoccus alkanivorans]|uniref:IclR family transcriptional regulator n=1 Tax=Paracoccus alkanivorans TaxID=2116655 RepID=A0A3M0MIL7_9RHOB|nr:IclR family transcriptional regulator [Paracoccus alkanivorans]RMC37592.1 IclR family transcriptional regulator [Paracoccus alkanivorans]